MASLSGNSITGKSLEDITIYLVEQIVKNDLEEVSPRGNKSKDLRKYSFTLTNPRDRLVSHPDRIMNYSFAIGEFLWNLRGSNSLEEIAYYNKRMEDFSDDGDTLDSAYGYRILGKHPDFPHKQWDFVQRQLKEDPNSKRAIMFITLPTDQLRIPTKDFPCTIYLDWLVREGKLHLHTHMRSNDLIWGVTYDAFYFTMLQEIMSLELGVPLGEYVHYADVFNLYERHYELAEKLVENKDLHKSIAMPALKELKEFRKLLKLEKELRDKKVESNYQFHDPVIKDFATILDYKAKDKNVPLTKLHECYTGVYRK